MFNLYNVRVSFVLLTLISGGNPEIQKDCHLGIDKRNVSKGQQRSQVNLTALLRLFGQSGHLNYRLKT